LMQVLAASLARSTAAVTTLAICKVTFQK